MATNHSGDRAKTVTLTKFTPSINLTKPGDRHGVMRVDLNWSAEVRRGLFRRPVAIALGLGCLYELADGAKGVVEVDRLGSLEAEPFIRLDEATPGGESLRIDLERPELFRRILLFAKGDADAPNWAAADGVVTLHPTTGPAVEVRLDEPVPSARSCAIALLQNPGQGITVHREVHYVDGAHRELDRAYQWGMDWD
ncbi:Tellurium resistance [Nocardia panacis]|uniref:Tellurium resistance n=1 Tax=Nocardia panacis TaxID=2340916 RepID=UPI001EF03297|nr:Tellurium resistance [Nocardia panacis]